MTIRIGSHEAPRCLSPSAIQSAGNARTVISPTELCGQASIVLNAVGGIAYETFLSMARWIIPEANTIGAIYRPVLCGTFRSLYQWRNEDPVPWHLLEKALAADNLVILTEIVV
jgi:hypothetical protein